MGLVRLTCEENGVRTFYSQHLRGFRERATALLRSLVE